MAPCRVGCDTGGRGVPAQTPHAASGSPILRARSAPATHVPRPGWRGYSVTTLPPRQKRLLPRGPHRHGQRQPERGLPEPPESAATESPPRKPARGRPSRRLVSRTPWAPAPARAWAPLLRAVRFRSLVGRHRRVRAAMRGRRLHPHLRAMPVGNRRTAAQHPCTGDAFHS